MGLYQLIFSFFPSRFPRQINTPIPQRQKRAPKKLKVAESALKKPIIAKPQKELFPLFSFKGEQSNEQTDRKKEKELEPS